MSLNVAFLMDRFSVFVGLPGGKLYRLIADWADGEALAVGIHNVSKIQIKI